MVPGTSLAAVDTGPADPAGQPAGVQAEAVALCMQERSSCMERATASDFCCSVNWRLVLVGLVIGRQSDGHGVALSDLSTERGEAQLYIVQASI